MFTIGLRREVHNELFTATDIPSPVRYSAKKACGKRARSRLFEGMALAATIEHLTPFSKRSEEALAFSIGL